MTRAHAHLLNKPEEVQVSLGAVAVLSPNGFEFKCFQDLVHTPF
jgi:hypothetical protein